MIQKAALGACAMVALTVLLCLLTFQLPSQEVSGAQPLEEDATPSQLPFKPQTTLLRDQFPASFSDKTYRKRGISVVGNSTLLICRIGKVASRVVSQLGARIDGDPNWHSGSVLDIASYLKQKARDDLTASEQKRPPSVVMVRNPVTKILSGYLDKLVNRPNRFQIEMKPEFIYCWDDACPEIVHSFEEFIGAIRHANMSMVNPHFTPQHTKCGFDEGLTYDCIISYENRAVGWKECLDKFGLWEKFGASGWGPSGTQAFFEVTEELYRSGSLRETTVTGDPDLLKKYYTPELLAAVIEIYKRDFELFGYSTEPSLYLGDNHKYRTLSWSTLGLNRLTPTLTYIMGLLFFFLFSIYLHVTPNHD